MSLNAKDSKYLEQLTLWREVRAAIAGKPEVLKIISCLPGPQYKTFTAHSGMSPEQYKQAQRCNENNRLRVQSYWSRGRFFPATGRTFQTLSGMLWSKEPEVDINNRLSYLKTNADGCGNGIREVAQKVSAELLTTGRYAILVDMPPAPIDTNGNATSLTPAQMDSGNYSPKFIKYEAERIPYVRTNGNGRSVDEVRLMECHSVQKDEFEWEEKEYIRRLIVIDGIYHNQLWDDKNEIISDVMPRANGKFLTEILIQFFGADDNSPEYSRVPLYDLANENLGHFVLDCDNRSLLHRYSQGMTNIFVKDGDVFSDENPGGLNINGDGVNQFGESDRVEILQLSVSDAIPNAKKTDIEAMIMSGAQVVFNNAATETLGAKRIDANANMSSLKCMSYNITDGFKQLLSWVSMFYGITQESTYKINSDFVTDDLSPEMIKIHMELVQGGLLPAITLNETARKAELTKFDDDAIAQGLLDQSELIGGTSEDQATLQAENDALREELEALKAGE
tara:strand:+ start:10584 stop:12107 length:1524 start_codon:yes stop_codon:yes gene_type:complete